MANAFMPTVFIADDDNLLIDFLRFRLERKGYEVRSSHDGQEALDQILSTPPDILLLDYQMPVRSAYEIIEILKQSPQCQHLPILVLASQWREKEVIDALELGITDYIVKPFSPQELLFRIDRALKQGAAS